MDETAAATTPEEQQLSTAWRRIADEIAKDVTCGALSAGDALPAAQDLAKQYGVHRHTVRQAYRHLQDVGLVKIRQGLGTFVNEAPLPYRIGRRVSFRENMRAFDIEAESRIVRTEVIMATHDLACDLNIPAGAILWRLYLVNRAAGRPLSVSRHFAACARFPDLPQVLTLSGSSFTSAFRAFGIDRYGRSSTRISARPATELEQEHLELSPGATALVTRSIDTAQGEPIQLVETIFRADQIELLVEND